MNGWVAKGSNDSRRECVMITVSRLEDGGMRGARFSGLGDFNEGLNDGMLYKYVN